MSALNHALAGERHGWSVIPLIGKVPPKEFDVVCHRTHRASAAQIRLWARQYPGCNFGVICGAISGLIVIDLDSIAAYNEAQRRGLPDTHTVRTGRRDEKAPDGGWQYYYQYDPAIRNGDAFQDCEVKSDGSYVVLSGSIHPVSHAVYTIVSPKGTNPAAGPDWCKGKPIVRTAQTITNFVNMPDNWRRQTENLYRISPDCSYKDWQRIARALYGELGENAYSLFDAWSAGSATKYPGPEATRRKWEYASKSPLDGRVITAIANEHDPAGKRRVG